MSDLHLLSILLFAISTSLDNLGTGVSYGLRKICIPFSLNLVIAISNSGGNLVTMLFGRVLSDVMRPHIAGLIGALMLSAIGVWIFITGFRKKGRETALTPGPPEETSPPKRTIFATLFAALDDPFAAGILCTGKVKLKEGAILAAALTLSNISTGIGAGLIGFNPAITTAAVFVCSVLAISLGMKIGGRSGALMIKGLAEKAAGLLLVFIGVYELAG